MSAVNATSFSMGSDILVSKNSNLISK